jgi:hypothetical protein
VNEYADIFCGCRFVRVKKNGPWYQVVACPDHLMDLRPQPDPPKPKLREAAS